MTRLLAFISLVTLFASVGCSTVTMIKGSQSKTSEPPSFEESKSFYLWGLVGEHDIYVDRVCSARSASQAMAQRTFVDGLLGVVTLGIYMPRTVKVWCD